VCEAIYAAGLDGFYRRTPEGEVLGPPPEPPKELTLYDIDEVQEEFVDSLGEAREINLLVEGIHCAACVWLIENGLESMPGVEEARVNLTGRRLRSGAESGEFRGFFHWIGFAIATPTLLYSGCPCHRLYK